MTFGSNMNYSVATGANSDSLEFAVLATDDPTSLDINYPIQKRWINTSNGNGFVLISFTGSAGVVTANWLSVGSATGNIVDHAVLIGGPDDTINSTAVGATGTVLIGNTAADPTFSGSPILSGTLTLPAVAQIYAGPNRNMILNNNTASVFIGQNAGNLTQTGGINYALGTGSLAALTTGQFNTSLGQSSLNNLTTGSQNTSIGTNELGFLVSGTYNIAIGGIDQIGNNYTTNEGSNILINGGLGVTGESNVLRIGSGTGVSGGNLSKAFISGINGVTSSSPAMVTINTSTDQLGTVPFVNLSTFTPTIAIGGSSTGVTYSTNTGNYVQIGNAVFFNLNITLTSIGGLTGGVAITGLPVSATGIPATFPILNYTNLTLTASYTDPFVLIGFPTATVMSLSQCGSGQATAGITNANIANNTSLYISGTYFV